LLTNMLLAVLWTTRITDEFGKCRQGFVRGKSSIKQSLIYLARSLVENPPKAEAHKSGNILFHNTNIKCRLHSLVDIFSNMNI
jgi:hypothetical protein